MTTPATQQEVEFIITYLTEQDDMTESEQQLFDIACEVYQDYIEDDKGNELCQLKPQNQQN